MRCCYLNAKDLGTGKEQSIKITASQKLNEADIEKMRKEAEQFAEQDKKRKEEIEIINQADSLVYSTDKLLEDFKGKIDDARITKVKEQIDELKKLLEEENKDVNKVKEKLDEINKIIQEMSIELYQQAGAKTNTENTDNPEDKVKDAEFEEGKK